MKRSGRIKPKRAKNRIGHFTKKVRLDAENMALLRQAVYDRSMGQCEMMHGKRRCVNIAGWLTGELHHVRHRSLGGSDDMDNCLFICKECHRKAHVPDKPCPPKPRYVTPELPFDSVQK